MNYFLKYFLLFEENTEPSTTDRLKDALLQIVKNPIFYVVVGVLLLLLLAFYLIRRIVKPSVGEIKVIVRRGKIRKLLDENSKMYFMVPFIDSLAASISLSEKELSSDKLFVNNGPDALYKINYSLKYKVTDAGTFFSHSNSLNEAVTSKINDSVREYAEQGHVQEIIKDYREHAEDLNKLLNSIVSEYGIEAVSFKINYIEPIGKK